MNSKKIFHNLKDVVLRELGEKLDKEQQKADWSRQLTEEMLMYAAKDAQVLIPLHHKLAAKVEDADLERVMEIEHRALPAIVWMANAGVPFDEEGWRRHLKRVEEAKGRLKLELNRLAPDYPEGEEWNWNSWQQILKVFSLLGVDLPNTKEETLSRCNHPLALTLLEYRKTAKIVGTYGSSLLEKVEDGRIYASWWQIGAGTGRMACSNPNLQNLPPEARKHIRAPEGRVLVTADYSQKELRIAAKISRDETMLAAFAEGLDIHTITARGLTGKEQVSKEDRKLAKAVNFGLLYGMGPEGLRNYARSSYGIEMAPEETERYWRNFFETYPGLKSWHDREWLELKRQANIQTRTLTGRRRTGVSKLTERLNSPVQGTGADGLKLALAYLWERRQECPGAVPILAVHDEIVVECSEDQTEQVEGWLKKAMIEGMDEVLNTPELEGPHVPIEVEVKSHRTWGE
jgi:DNA polymerase-1